jgi:hypothetical protein
MKSFFPTLIIGAVMMAFFWQLFKDIKDIKNLEGLSGKQIEFGINSVQAQKTPEASQPLATPTQVKMKEEEVRKQMLQISKELGVTCAYCHNVQNWKDNQKIQWKISAEHIKLVEAIRPYTMNGKDKITEVGCYLCHRGEAKYRWR